MKRLLVLFLLIASPTFGQGVFNCASQTFSGLAGANANDNLGCNVNSNSTQTVSHNCYADPVKAGNTGLVGVSWADSATTVAVTDDAGSTYTSMIGPSRNASGSVTQIFRASPLTTGAHQVTFTFSAAATNIKTEVCQLFNVSTSTPSCGTPVNTANNGSNTTISAGAIVPAVSGCFYVQWDCEADQFGARPQYTVGSGWNFEDVDFRVGCAMQTKVNAGSSSLTCSMTTAAGKTENTSCVAFRPDLAQGTAPTGMYVRNLVQFPMLDTSTTYTFQNPCSGNLGAWVSNSFQQSTSVSSISHANPGTSFSQVGSGASNTEGVQQVFWDVQTWTNASTSSFTNSDTNSNDAIFYCIVGASSTGQPDSSLATFTATDPTGSQSMNAYTVTTTSSSGIILGAVGLALGNSEAAKPPTTVALPCSTAITCMQDNQNNNNTWHHYTYSSSGAQAQVVIQKNSTTGAGAVSGAAAAFKAPSASVTPSGRPIIFGGI